MFADQNLSDVTVEGASSLVVTDSVRAVAEGRPSGNGRVGSQLVVDVDQNVVARTGVGAVEDDANLVPGATSSA